MVMKAFVLSCGIAISANALAQTTDDATNNRVRDVTRANAMLHCYFLAQLADIPGQDDFLIEGISVTKRAYRDVLVVAEEGNIQFCGGERSCELILEHGGSDVLAGIAIQQASDNVEFQKRQEIEKRVNQNERLDLKLWAIGQFRISNCELLLP
jgi:hypothetical protein